MISYRAIGIILVVGLLGHSYGQSLPSSPCPNVFRYEEPGTERGRWYGVVTLSTDITLHGLWLNIVLDSKADILGNWVGDVTTTDNIDFKIENTKMKIQPGAAQTIRFFVQYNQLSKVPQLTTIRVNGREICNSRTPSPAVERPDEHQTVSEVNEKPFQTVLRPVEERPVRPVGNTDDQRPIYISTENPPLSQINVNPYSIGDGSVSAQDTSPQTSDKRPNSQSRPTTTQSRPSTTQTRPRPSQSAGVHIGGPQTDDNFPDYEEGSVGTDTDYFGGGLPTIPKAPNSGSSSNNLHCGKVVRNATPLIVNGKATLEGQWPWQIALYQTQTVDNKYICGGTLVSRNFVVTAAHCVTRKGSNRLVNKNTLTVYLGKHNLRTSIEGVQIKFVGEITVHEQYNASSYSHDVAVLKFRDSAQFSDYVRPACLWPEDRLALSYIIGQRGSVVGWGFDDKGVATEELTLVEMPVVDQETCIRSYSEFFARFTSDLTFCAGYRDGIPNGGRVNSSSKTKRTSVCNGDSGGGMVFKIEEVWYLRGLVSLSVARQNEYRCDPTHYVVFTDLAKYLTWLKQVMASDF